MYIRLIGDLFFCCFVGIQKLSSISAGMKSPQSHYDDVDLGLHSHLKTSTKTTSEPQYEVCGGGVTSTDLVMEENPAYQSVDVAAAKS